MESGVIWIQGWGSRWVYIGELEPSINGNAKGLEDVGFSLQPACQ